MSEEKPLAEWQKRCHKLTVKSLKAINDNPEKYGVTREHIKKVEKDIERILSKGKQKRERGEEVEEETATVVAIEE